VYDFSHFSQSGIYYQMSEKSKHPGSDEGHHYQVIFITAERFLSYFPLESNVKICFI
jgi:hypothetical protein